MTNAAFLMQLMPGALVEYRRRHADAWPELLDAIRAAGVETFTIYGGRDRLFVHSEVRDAEAWPRVWATGVHARWGATMADLIALDVNNAPMSASLEQVFHMERS